MLGRFRDRVFVVRNFVESRCRWVRLEPDNMELHSTLQMAFFALRAGALQHRIKLYTPITWLIRSSLSVVVVSRFGNSCTRCI